MIGVLEEEREEEAKETHIGKAMGGRQVEFGMTYLQGMECEEWPATTRTQRETRIPPPELQKEHSPDNLLIANS